MTDVIKPVEMERVHRFRARLAMGAQLAPSEQKELVELVERQHGLLTQQGIALGKAASQSMAAQVVVAAATAWGDYILDTAIDEKKSLAVSENLLDAVRFHRQVSS